MNPIELSPADPPGEAGVAQPRVAVIGAGPAGLMAAEALMQAGARVDVYDGMPSAGRKFLLAGKGGLNLTHSEPLATFVQRYGERADAVAAWLAVLDAQGLRDWAAGLGIDTFVGSSGKVFPAEMKAAPLLRAWLHRLRAGGVRLHMRHRWTGVLAPQQAAGWQLAFSTPRGDLAVQADAVVLALGGASWARLGSDGAWLPWLSERGVAVAPLLSSNCGFDVAWSPHLRERHAGAPLKGLRLRHTDRHGRVFSRLGEALLSEQGLEGALVYAASAQLRDEIAATGAPTTLTLDLQPQRELGELTQALSRGRAARSWANHLREHAGLHGVKAALLREGLDAAGWAALTADPAALAARIKALPVTVSAPRPIDEAISSAGGVRLEAMDARLMLSACPGVFCAGEMLDWEAPTGGYLLTACLASGRVAGQGVAAWWAAGRQACAAEAGVASAAPPAAPAGP